MVGWFAKQECTKKSYKQQQKNISTVRPFTKQSCHTQHTPFVSTQLARHFT